MNGAPTCVALAAARTRVVAAMSDGSFRALDLATGTTAELVVPRVRPHAMTATDAHLLYELSPPRRQLCLADTRANTWCTIDLPPGLRVTHMCADPDSDGFLFFGYDPLSYTHGRAFALGLDGAVQPLAVIDQQFWADYCRTLPGRTALVNYRTLPTAVDLNTGVERRLTPAELALHMPSSAPIVFGRRYTPGCFPAAEREFAPIEAYSPTDHRLFGPRARATALALLLLAHLGPHRLSGRLLERLLAAAVRVAAPPPPLLTYEQHLRRYGPAP